MKPLTETELGKLAEDLWRRIEDLNGQYVRQELCEERSSNLKRAIYGLYGCVGVTFAVVLAQLIQMIRNG